MQQPHPQSNFQYPIPQTQAQINPQHPITQVQLNPQLHPSYQALLAQLQSSQAALQIPYPQVQLPIPPSVPQVQLPVPQPPVQQYQNPFSVPYVPPPVPQPKKTYIYDSNLWNEIHQKAKEATTLPLKNEYVNLLNEIVSSHGCGGCAIDMKNFIAQNKLESYFPLTEVHLGKNIDIGLFRWSWLFHNHVNKKLRKVEPTFEEIVKRWYQ